MVKLNLKEMGMRICIGFIWCEKNMQQQVRGNVMNLWFHTRQGFIDLLSSIEFLIEAIAVWSLSYLSFEDHVVLHVIFAIWRHP
jgi:hypothetical protein